MAEPTPKQGVEHASGILCATHRIYSLSCSEYEDLWERSSGCCEACGESLNQRKTRGSVEHAIDHDHRYGKSAVRGIVCLRCNSYLGRLESPRVRPAFGSGPGRWFAGYFRRVWFVRRTVAEPAGDQKLLDHDRFRSELRDWTSYNKHLFTQDPKAAVIPTDSPSEIVNILRVKMSPQAFASLVRLLKRDAETAEQAPKAA